MHEISISLITMQRCAFAKYTIAQSLSSKVLKCKSITIIVMCVDCGGQRNVAEAFFLKILGGDTFFNIKHK